MTFPAANSDRDRVLEAADLVALIGEHITLRPQGREHVGLCPFHDDRSPSLHVVTHKGNAFYKCFACGASGNAIDFVMNFHRMDFPAAIRHLGARFGIPISERRSEVRQSGPTKTDLHDANGFALRWFQSCLRDPGAGSAARSCLQERRINSESVAGFSLGASPSGWDHLLNRIRREKLDPAVFEAAGLLKSRREGEGWFDTFRNRLMFPIWDEIGNPIAFGARKLNPDDEPKYLNSPETPIFNKSKALYGLHLARRSIIDSRTAVVTEGYIDVIACHAAGFTNVVATLGTALTREHAKVLKRLCSTVVLLFDGDEAGQKASDRAIDIFFNETIDVRICTLPDSMDPDDLLRQEDGRRRFSEALERSQDILAFMTDRFASRLSRTAGISDRQLQVESLLRHLVELGFNDMSGVRRAMVVSAIADRCGLAPAQVDAAARSMSASRRKAADLSPSSPVEVESSSIHERIICPANRRIAERRLLAALLASPHLAGERIDIGEGHSLPITEAHPAESMRHPPHREVLSAILGRLESSREVTIQCLMADLASASARDLASALYLEGLKSFNDSMDDALTELRSACADLEHLDRREQAANAKDASDLNEDPLARAVNNLDLIRRRGADQTAIARRIRA